MELSDRTFKKIILVMFSILLYFMLKYTFIWVGTNWGYEVEDDYGPAIATEDPNFQLPNGYFVIDKTERGFAIQAWDGRFWNFTYNGTFLNESRKPVFYYAGCAMIAILTNFIGWAIIDRRTRKKSAA